MANAIAVPNFNILTFPLGGAQRELERVSRIFSGGFRKPLRNPFAAPDTVAAPAFSPTQLSGIQWLLETDGTLWQDSARSVSVTADSDPIGSMDDKSSNNHHAKQSTSSKRLTYKTGIQNGKAGALTDSTDDFLVTDSIAHGIGTGEFYFCFALKTGTLSSAGTYCVIAHLVTPGYAFVFRNNTNKLGMYWGGDWNFDTTLSDNTSYILEWYRESGRVKASVNGVVESTSVALTDNIATSTTEIAGHNASLPMRGYWFGGCFVNNLPSSGDRTSVRSYFNDKLAIF